MNRRTVTILTLVILMSLMPTWASNPTPIKLWVKGKYVESDAAPYIENNRTLVPIRVITENLLYEVGWQGKERKVTVGDKVTLWIGKTTALLNGEEKTLDVAPVIKENRTFVPLRFIAEAFQETVDWDKGTRTAIVGEEYPRITEPQTIPVFPNTTATPQPTKNPEPTGQPKAESYYIGNRNSHIFHRPNCGSVKKMKDKNKVTLQPGETTGWKSCSMCKP